MFEAAKIASRDTLRISRAAIANASDDLRDRYKILEQVCKPMPREELFAYLASKEGTFQNKTSDELKGDLETEKNNLELNRGANPGVVEQYQKRKREVSAQDIFRIRWTDEHPHRSRLLLRHSAQGKGTLKRLTGLSSMLG